MSSGRYRPPSAEGGRPADPPLAERKRAALAERYLGAALVGLAILLFWSLRLVMARWSG